MLGEMHLYFMHTLSPSEGSCKAISGKHAFKPSGHKAMPLYLCYCIWRTSGRFWSAARVLAFASSAVLPRDLPVHLSLSADTAAAGIRVATC